MERTEGLAVRESGALMTSAGQRPRIAIVGGTPSSALVASVLCQQFGCATVQTPTGESVLALLRRDTPVDLVVIDLSMPDMDGIVAVQLIRAMGARGSLPVVALTSDRSEMATNRARAAGFSGAVVKPYSPRELYTAMQSALSKTKDASASA
ncbi:MAG TPA: response regulator [Bauldia sp.]|nr:response regulator [Bauldia sp.]